jgi:UDP-N-acetylmuramoyl-tripeptide--D-alanyl-D-alanine ligase
MLLKVGASRSMAPRSAATSRGFGTAHYELFGSQAAIAEAKGELPAALPAHGSAVLNADDPLVAAMAGRTRAKVVTFAVHAEAHVRAAGLRLDGAGRPCFRLLTPDGAAETVLPLPGEHLVPDALAAAAAGWALGIGPADIAAGLAGAEPSPMRMQVLRRGDGVTVVNDAYNANPASMAAGLKALQAARRPGGRTVAVLGGMAELGAIAEEEHDRIGRLVVRLGIDRLVGVGQLGHLIVRAARLEGIWEPDDAAMVETVDEAVAAVGSLGPDDVVLVKASRAIGLDRVADALMVAG